MLRTIIAFCALLPLALVIVSHHAITRSSTGRVFSEPSELPSVRVGLVLGTSRYTRSGLQNRYFSYRIDAAAELFHSGYVEHLIASGDNSRLSYNEPEEMRRALVEAGVPNDVIYLDYAGFRTLDSVLRAKSVFSQERVIIVSQAFHISRAIYIARHHGIDAYGYSARDVEGRSGAPTMLREVFARVMAVLDVHLLNRRPRFGGSPVEIGSRR